jgi:hypothetical protein
LYHAIVDWDKRPPVEPSLKGIFETGNLLEKEMFRFFNAEVGPRMDPPMCLIKPVKSKTDKLLRQYNISMLRERFPYVHGLGQPQAEFVRM